MASKKEEHDDTKPKTKPSHVARSLQGNEEPGLDHMSTDNWPLYDSIHSTKQAERKTMRHAIQIMKDAVSRGKVEKSIWVYTKNMIADVLTKESAPTFLITEILDNGWVDTKNMIADVLTKESQPS